jgi:hypothetical protein
MACTFPNRIYAQYRSKPKAVAWYNIVPTMANEFCAVYDAIKNSYDIDTNEGEQLNVIGRVVGVERPSIEGVLPRYTQYGSAQFGSAQFSALSTDDINAISDELYRLLIKAKIAKNTSDATIDSIIEAVEVIVRNNKVTLIDNEDMTFEVNFSQPLSDIERDAIENFDIIPRPQGVRFNGYSVSPYTAQFGSSRSQFGGSKAQFTGQFI